MSFKNIIKLATQRQNEINSKVTPTGFPVKLAPPKKETKIKGLQSKHVQAVIEKLNNKKLKRNLKIKSSEFDSSNEYLSDDSVSNRQKLSNQSTNITISSNDGSLLDSSNNDFNLTNLFTKYDRRVARMDSDSVPNMLELLNQREKQRKQKQQEDMQRRDEIEQKRREERLSLNQSSQSTDVSCTDQIATKIDKKIKKVEIKDNETLIKENEKKILEEKKLKRQKAEQEAALRLKFISSARDEILRLKLNDTKRRNVKAPQKKAIKRPGLMEDYNLDFKIPKKTTQNEINDIKPSLKIPTLQTPKNTEDRPMTQEEKEQLARRLCNKLKHNNNINNNSELNEHQSLQNIKKKNTDIYIESDQLSKKNEINKNQIIQSQKLSSNNQISANDVSTNKRISNDNVNKMENLNKCKNNKDFNIKKENLNSVNNTICKMNSATKNDLIDEFDLRKNKPSSEFKLNSISANLQQDKRKSSSEINKIKINGPNNYNSVSKRFLNNNEIKLHNHQNDGDKTKHKNNSNVDKLKRSGNIRGESDQTKDLNGKNIKDKNNYIGNLQNNNPNYKSGQENVANKSIDKPAVQNQNAKENPYKPIQGQASAWDRITNQLINTKQSSQPKKKKVPTATLR